MLQLEVLELVMRADPASGDRLNDIVDEFRSGRDPRDLLACLDADQSEVVSVGAWMLGELDFEFYRSEEFVSRLYRLLDHSDPAVRFHALGAIFPALDQRDERTRVVLERLSCDPNEGVRVSARAAATRLGLLGLD